MSDNWRAVRSILDAALASDRRLTIATALLEVGGWILLPVQALAIARFFDAIVAGDPDGAVIPTIATGLAVGGLWYINNLRQFVRQNLNEKTVHRLDQGLQTFVGEIDTVDHLEQPDYLDRLATLRTQGQWFGNVVGLFELPALSLNVVISAALLFTVDPLLLLVPLGMVPSVILTGRSERVIQDAETAAASDRRMRARTFELATDPAVAGEARLFASGTELLARHAAANRRVAVVMNRAGWIDILFATVGWAFYAVALGLVFVIVVSGIGAARLTIGDLFLTFFLVRGLTFQAQFTLYAIREFRRTLTASRGYLWLADHAAAEERRERRGEPLPAAGPLRFEGVSYRYPAAERTALATVDLEIPPGAVVAIVGDNGAGKTTLVKLLARFHEPTSGRITLGGHDIAAVESAAWRRGLTACFQDFCRFELSAGETVGVGDLPRIDDQGRIEAAIEAAGAGDVITSLPAGLATPLGASWAEGAELSVGQWQKLALSRAMMRDEPRILLLDEPTAALDAEAEARLFERYAAASRFAQTTGSITIIVSHRMSTVRLADTIVVIDDGVVVDTGSHADLVVRDGPYRDLYSTQASAYR